MMKIIIICNASPGDGLPNEKGSNGGDGGNGERIDSMNIWLIKIFPGGRGKFAGNGGHGGVGGESDIKYIQKVYPIFLYPIILWLNVTYFHSAFGEKMFRGVHLKLLFKKKQIYGHKAEVFPSFYKLIL